MDLELENNPRFRNFDWEKAKNFYYVAKCGSFISAGRFLNISQSALSRQIINLEEHLGFPLFSRHSAGVKITRKGKELFTLVEATYIGFKGFTQNNHVELANGKKRKIRIASTHAVNAYILDSLVFDYNKLNPHLVFELFSADHLIDIVMNDVDIAIRPYESGVQGIVQELLFTLEKKLFASLKYLEKYGEPQTVEDLKHHSLIGHAHPEEHPYSDVNWILKLGMPEGQSHNPILTSNSIECLIKAAKKGMGIVSSYDEMDIIKNSNLKNILPEVKEKKVDWYFIFPNYFRKDNEIASLKKYLQQNLAF